MTTVKYSTLAQARLSLGSWVFWQANFLSLPYFRFWAPIFHIYKVADLCSHPNCLRANRAKLLMMSCKSFRKTSLSPIAGIIPAQVSIVNQQDRSTWDMNNRDARSETPLDLKTCTRDRMNCLKLLISQRDVLKVRIIIWIAFSKTLVAVSCHSGSGLKSARRGGYLLRNKSAFPFNMLMSFIPGPTQGDIPKALSRTFIES